MSDPINSATALLTEHLRHTPVSLMDDIINSVNTIGYKAVESVEQALFAASPENLGFNAEVSSAQNESEARSLEEKAKFEIENGVHQLETLLEATIDKHFDIMEVVALRTHIAIPEDLGDWIKLRHYEGLNFTSSSDAPTTDSITLLRRKVQETHRLQRLLTSEVSRTAALIERMKALRSEAPLPKPEPDTDSRAKPASAAFEFLQDRGSLGDGTASTPLSTTSQFALSQLPALKALLAELRPQMQALKDGSKSDPNLVENEKEKSWRRQRVEYIESQSRRHLENVGGLELGRNGEVRDGEWQGEGRRLGKGEVVDLERVVAMMGGNVGSIGEEMEVGA